MTISGKFTSQFTASVLLLRKTSAGECGRTQWVWVRGWTCLRIQRNGFVHGEWVGMQMWMGWVSFFAWYICALFCNDVCLCYVFLMHACVIMQWCLLGLSCVWQDLHLSYGPIPYPCTHATMHRQRCVDREDVPCDFIHSYNCAKTIVCRQKWCTVWFQWSNRPYPLAFEQPKWHPSPGKMSG